MQTEAGNRRRRGAWLLAGVLVASGVGRDAGAQDAPTPLDGPPPPPPAPGGLDLRPLPPPPEPGADTPMPGDADTPLGDLATPLATPRAEITLHVGRSRIFELKRPVSRVFLSNPAIAAVRFLDQDEANPKLLDLYGLSFGSCDLTLWDDQGRALAARVRVTIDAADLERRIARLFPGADVRIEQLAAQVILEGQVPDAKTMSEVLQVVQSALIGEAMSLAVNRGGLGGMGGGAPRMTRGDGGDGVVRTGLAQQQPGAVDPGVVAPPTQPGFDEQGEGGEYATDVAPAVPMTAGGSPAALSQRGGLLSVSPRAGGGQLPPGTIVNRVRVPGPRQILLKVKIAELNRTAIREIGANFQARIGNNVINSVVGGIGPAQSQLFGIFDSDRFSIFLNALRQNNLARILAEPNLVALDGQPARFLAGGSFPFPVPQAGLNGANVITIQFRDFGAILQFIPHIIADDAIRLDVEPSFSELNFGAGTSVQGTTVPGINQRSARTVVELREGQTLAIAGLLSTRTNAFATRIPLLGDAPLVGPFFSRNRIETQETELVVLVTPELVDPLDANEVPLGPGDWYKEPNDCEFYLLGRIEGRTGAPFRATIAELDPWGIMRHVQSEQKWVVGPHGHAD
jgi:pilus assembly protein CpaC